MEAERKAQEAILTELKRQSETREGLTVATADATTVRIEGRVDLVALAAAVVGALAGGP